MPSKILPPNRQYNNFDNRLLSQQTASEIAAGLADAEKLQAECEANDSLQNLDGQDVEDLRVYVQQGKHPYQLREYATFKILAMVNRLAGRIELAVRHEDKCERLYKKLPPFMKW